jgi:hypothetical protein
MKPTSTSGLQSHMSWWSDSPDTKRTCKRMSHRADRRAARQVPQDGWDGDDVVNMITYEPAGPETDDMMPPEEVYCPACDGPCNMD